MRGGGLAASRGGGKLLSRWGTLPSERTVGRLRGRGGLDVEAVPPSGCCPRGDLGGVSEGWERKNKEEEEEEH